MANTVELTRIRLAAAENSVQSAKHESRMAKRKRKEAKDAARRAKKRLRRAKQELAEAKVAVSKAASKNAQATKSSTVQPVPAEPGPSRDLQFPVESVSEPAAVKSITEPPPPVP
jgi:vacuolar-type H+-ATPase subunit D/Vma8